MLFVVSLQTFGLNAAAKHLQDWSGPASSDLSLEAERQSFVLGLSHSRHEGETRRSQLTIKSTHLLLRPCMYVQGRGMCFSLNVFMSAINVMCMSEDDSDQVTVSG